MKLLLVGCEYSGTSTLANRIRDWWKGVSGRDVDIQDHFRQGLSTEDFARYLAVGPEAREVIEREHIYAHAPFPEDIDSDRILIGLHIEDSVYGPMLFGYGTEGAPGDRTALSQRIDHRFQRFAPETVRVFVKASPEVISRRLKESPHANGILKEKDVEEAVRRFEDAANGAQSRRKFEIDTSTATVQETMTEFVEKVEGHLTEMDRYRILLHSHWEAGRPI